MCMYGWVGVSVCVRARASVDAFRGMECSTGRNRKREKERERENVCARKRKNEYIESMMIRRRGKNVRER